MYVRTYVRNWFTFFTLTQQTLVAVTMRTRGKRWLRAWRTTVCVRTSTVHTYRCTYVRLGVWGEPVPQHPSCGRVPQALQIAHATKIIVGCEPCRLSLAVSRSLALHIPRFVWIAAGPSATTFRLVDTTTRRTPSHRCRG